MQITCRIVLIDIFEESETIISHYVYCMHYIQMNLTNEHAPSSLRSSLSIYYIIKKRLRVYDI